MLKTILKLVEYIENHHQRNKDVRSEVLSIIAKHVDIIEKIWSDNLAKLYRLKRIKNVAASDGTNRHFAFSEAVDDIFWQDLGPRPTNDGSVQSLEQFLLMIDEGRRDLEPTVNQDQSVFSNPSFRAEFAIVQAYCGGYLESRNGLAATYSGIMTNLRELELEALDLDFSSESLQKFGDEVDCLKRQAAKIRAKIIEIKSS